MSLGFYFKKEESSAFILKKKSLLVFSFTWLFLQRVSSYISYLYMYPFHMLTIVHTKSAKQMQMFFLMSCKGQGWTRQHLKQFRKWIQPKPIGEKPKKMIIQNSYTITLLFSVDDLNFLQWQNRMKVHIIECIEVEHLTYRQIETKLFIYRV